MSDSNRADDIQLYENMSDVTRITEVKKCAETCEPSLKVLQLVSIFESEESKMKLKILSQGRSTAEPENESAVAAGHSESERSSSPSVDGAAEEAAASSSGGHSDACASGVAVTNYVGGSGCGWMERPARNLLVVIHPWCMLRKSSDADRQSEFPPPGFLERLKAKLLALHLETDEKRRLQCPAASAATNRRRRNNIQKIKRWFQYTAAVAALQGTGPRTKAIAAPSAAAAASRAGRGAAADGAGAGAAGCRNEPVVVDFLTVRRRYAAAVATSSAHRDINDC